MIHLAKVSRSQSHVYHCEGNTHLVIFCYFSTLVRSSFYKKKKTVHRLLQTLSDLLLRLLKFACTIHSTIYIALYRSDATIFFSCFAVIVTNRTYYSLDTGRQCLVYTIAIGELINANGILISSQPIYVETALFFRLS